ncbi:branched-chain alpha-keto acid dehydrogenase E1-alpha subunit [Desarmillaria tabescens]|uniref:2-oxoisovalerate dehydrogenase subunit alpha n=1 Tax=Armillaria tabescens TaxID=1929756 RepID=A0AA39TN10_ARMTA|nr:branched-chain alpha-keto acid dehydrogenase E1-alpha subunit [Desarmillaria tabescens]KAK0464652.1 branched-chain alpha-keto acid dehydrogenase E1-alpha subunit [Desarmillaria tabescens]
MFRSVTTGRLSVLKQSNFRPLRSYSQPRERLPHSQSPIVSRPEFFNTVTSNGQQIPTYRVLDSAGKLLDATSNIEIDEQLARRLYENMQLLPALDNILYNVQRQGKISFYYGEEATITGAAAGLAMNDDQAHSATVLHVDFQTIGQYREMGVLLWRNFGIRQVFAQCFGNHEDMSGKGRQMPVHFGSPEHHFHTISSPLATQIPQAAGVAYALRRMRSGTVAACFFGEGAASEGDFHAGLMLASTIPSPVIFIVRNNGFAISTPSTEQYNGDGIASRGPGYGIDTIRVDGNDVLAVMTAVKEARQRCVEQGRPALVEAMTYRVGHHSTSDDSFAYRARSEVEDRKRIDNPIVRFRLFMESQGWWDAEAEEALKTRLKADVMKEFKRAESTSLCEVGELFTDVYGGEMPWNIREQREELGSLLKKYSKSWEPWRNQLAKYKNEGQDIMKE